MILEDSNKSFIKTVKRVNLKEIKDKLRSLKQNIYKNDIKSKSIDL